MPIDYDAETDILTITFREDKKVIDSDELEPGVIVDYGEEENILSVEIMDISRRIKKEGTTQTFETGGTSERNVIVYKLNDTWHVQCPSLPIQPQFGKTEEEALHRMSAKIDWYLKDQPNPAPNIEHLKIVSIESR